jgi:hypothetical protein
LAQNPLGGYGVGDDDDLPVAPAAQPAAQPQPRNPQGQFQSPAATAAQAAPTAPAAQTTQAEPATPQHNPYMVARARALGIDPNQFAADTLPAVLLAVEQNRQAAPAPAAPATPPAPEPGPDWGEDDQGNPITSEEQALKVYPRAFVKAIKASHQVEKLQKQNQELQQRIERDAQERNAARVDAKLNKILANRPDLFGADVDPAIAAHRRAAVVNHLNGLVAAKQHTTLEQDAAGAMAIFGPAPTAPAGPRPAAKPAGPSPTDLAAAYRRAELARPTGRAGAEPIDRRSLLIEIERTKMAENGSPVAVGGDDDDDLPGPHKG